ncbi:hypothetical protein EV193_108123 [Herbihabitans rhizosphaerae]|uniref:Uncharacterized protein n=1 Tax=Herbihabitans rhizosphaerae TaxID=1872711 RepID=A0A4Q7KKI1_9PSEU|nr:hypothetical protein [Herbihabitans rhizosphaerae]RZS34775.1 hypothetical protein EV193_108123 [Herbihabitans rhizosphaerae]
MGPRGRDLIQLTQLVSRHVNGPVAQQIRDRIARRDDPDVRRAREWARLERRAAWASRWMTLWALITVICTVIVVVALTGVSDFKQPVTLALGCGAVGLVSGTFAFRSGQRLRVVRRAQRDFGEAPKSRAVPAASAVLPPRGSVAREPMVRLADAEETLGELLTQLSTGKVAVPVESIEHARATGAEAAAALRSVAARVQAVERAREAAPASERAVLSDGIRDMRRQLDEGLDGYGTLVAAVGRLVVDSPKAGPDRDALTDATDHLAGLAAALRDLAPHNP